MRDALGTQWEEGHFVAGEVSLDFANTVFRRWPEIGADLLVDPAALARWLVLVGLVDRPDAVDDAALQHARRLRTALWAVFDAQRDGVVLPAEGLVTVLDQARRGCASISVSPAGEATSSNVVGALAAIALRALALVLHPPARGICACDRCGWFFLDSPRGRPRRWCSMRTCGNQAKAARHRARTTAGTDDERGRSS